MTSTVRLLSKPGQWPGKRLRGHAPVSSDGFPGARWKERFRKSTIHTPAPVMHATEGGTSCLAVLPSWGREPGRPMTLRPALSRGLPFSDCLRTVAQAHPPRKCPNIHRPGFRDIVLMPMSQAGNAPRLLAHRRNSPGRNARPRMRLSTWTGDSQRQARCRPTTAKQLTSFRFGVSITK